MDSKIEDMNAVSTVKLNVGGKIFELYRSLIEQYPDTILTKAIVEDDKDKKSVVQQVVDEEVIFFDSDSERFGYILDYMRDGKVALPCFNISKEALMEDFLYFGFRHIDPRVIKRDLTIPVVMDKLKCYKSTYSNKLSECEKAQAEAIENKREATLGYCCLIEHLEEGKGCAERALPYHEFKEKFDIRTDKADYAWEGHWVWIVFRML